MNVTIDKSGRVLIPKQLRDRLGFAPGTELVLNVHDTGDGAPALEIRAVRDEPLLAREGNLLVYTGTLEPGAENVLDFIKAQRDKRTRRLAGLDSTDGDATS